jgi:GTP-binding protein
MKIHQVEFVISGTKLDHLPASDLPEYAFVGRSNVGKSSLINALTGRNSLARVSKQPGKTQTINYFKVNDKWHLVDLPGYGYAKVSKKMRSSWDKMIFDYLKNRKQLVTAMVLIDARIPPQKNDMEFINRLGEGRIPFVMVFTKVDKLKRSEKHQLVPKFRKAMKEHWTELPPVFLTSSIKKEGIDELLNYIGELNKELEV